MFVAIPNAPSISTGTVSSSILAPATCKTPAATPNKNFPRTIALKLSTIYTITPTEPKALKLSTVLLLPLLTTYPPRKEPAAMPATEKALMSEL